MISDERNERKTAASGSPVPPRTEDPAAQQPGKTLFFCPADAEEEEDDDLYAELPAWAAAISDLFLKLFRFILIFLLVYGGGALMVTLAGKLGTPSFDPRPQWLDEVVAAILYVGSVLVAYDAMKKDGRKERKP